MAIEVEIFLIGAFCCRFHPEWVFFIDRASIEVNRIGKKTTVVIQGWSSAATHRDTHPHLLKGRGQFGSTLAPLSFLEGIVR